MHSAVKMPVNQWFCMSWHFDTAAQRMSFAVDDQTVLEIANMGAGCVGAPPDATLGGKWVYPAEVDSLTFGWQEYEASTGTRELWIDDIALGPNPLSCK
jgi:hypothetical protein